jgi:hypothetical protein
LVDAGGRARRFIEKLRILRVFGFFAGFFRKAACFPNPRNGKCPADFLTEKGIVRYN